MSEPLAERLQQLEEAWRRAGARIGTSLAPGASEKKVTNALGLKGLRPSEELLTWYAWHDGLLPGTTYGQTHVGYDLLSVDQSLEHCNIRQDVALKVAGFDSDPNLLWSRYWWPICSLGSDDIVASMEHPEADTPVYRVARDEGPDSAPKSADSMLEFVEAWLHLLEIGYATWDETIGWWQLHPDRLPEGLSARGTRLRNYGYHRDDERTTGAPPDPA